MKRRGFLRAAAAALAAPNLARGASNKVIRFVPYVDLPDGSKIVGKILASEPAPKARPWLPLPAESSGSRVLAGARFVQRLNTSDVSLLAGKLAENGQSPDDCLFDALHNGRATHSRTADHGLRP